MSFSGTAFFKFAIIRMRTESVTSGQNPKIKELLALQEKSRTRREKGLFTVEGRRELCHCLDAGFKARTLFICREIIQDRDLGEIISRPGCRDASVIEIPAGLYSKVAYRDGTEGIIGVMETRERALESISLGKDPLIAVLESVEKPGNLGAVLRSADACGADAVIICDPLTDLYNPNLIRASIGAVFTRQVVTASSEDTVRWLKKNGIKILTAQLQDSEWYYDTDMRGGVAIVMGTEATGLSDFWRKSADAHIRIPMLGQLDSLNVSVSAAVLLYEAVRQRHITGNVK